VRRELLARNVRSAARELADQLRRRGVYRQAERTDGMAALAVLVTVPEAAALLAALGQYADAVVDDPEQGPPRTREQKMADCLLDLVLRPAETDAPAVRAALTVVAPVATAVGGDQPAEVAGQPVPAELARALAQGLGLLPAPQSADVRGEQPGEGEARAPGEDWELPAAEEQRFWEQAAAEMAADPEWAARFDEPDAPPIHPPPAPGSLPRGAPEPSWWAAADAALDQATAAQRAADRALAAARRAVSYAEGADRADIDARDQSAEGRVSRASDALAALAHATGGQRAALGALLERTAGGGLADRPRIALTDALTGALLALTDAPSLRAAGSCGARACRTGAVVCDHDLTGRPGLGPPPPSGGYRPGAELERFLRARDRRCRQPGCRNRVAELDHNVPWPDGPTAAHQMTGFCTGHHRGKHQAPGWNYDLTDQGTLVVTTPTGMTATPTPRRSDGSISRRRGRPRPPGTTPCGEAPAPGARASRAAPGTPGRNARRPSPRGCARYRRSPGWSSGRRA
jgi:hypothetical protein